MRLRRGVLAMGLVVLGLFAGPGVLLADEIADGGTPVVDAAAVETPTIVPEATATDVAQEMTEAHVAVWLCDDAKCPEPTAILADVLVSAVDRQSEQLLGECLTAGDPAGCMLPVPTTDTWDLAWDESAIPAGYRFDSIAVVTGGAWETGYIIQYVPDDGPTEPQVETVHVGVMLCDSADCVADGELLAGVGVASVNTNTNTQVDNCETAGDPAVCEIDLPLLAPWTFTWDSTAIPEGYHYIGELAVVEGGAYPTVYLIRLVPDGVPTQVPTAAPVTPVPTKAAVSSLPKTGAGERDGISIVPLALLAGAGLGLAGAGAMARRSRM